VVDTLDLDDEVALTVAALLSVTGQLLVQGMAVVNGTKPTEDAPEKAGA